MNCACLMCCCFWAVPNKKGLLRPGMHGIARGNHVLVVFFFSFFLFSSPPFVSCLCLPSSVAQAVPHGEWTPPGPFERRAVHGFGRWVVPISASALVFFHVRKHVSWFPLLAFNKSCLFFPGDFGNGRCSDLFSVVGLVGGVPFIPQVVHF